MLRIGVMGLLLLAGVGLLRRSPLAASLHRLWAWIMVLMVSGAIVLWVIVGAIDFSSILEAVAGLVVFVFLVLGYPVFLLIWFSRRKVRRQVLAWRLARAKRT